MGLWSFIESCTERSRTKQRMKDDSAYRPYAEMELKKREVAALEKLVAQGKRDGSKA